MPLFLLYCLDQLEEWRIFQCGWHVETVRIVGRNQNVLAEALRIIDTIKILLLVVENAISSIIY